MILEKCKTIWQQEENRLKEYRFLMKPTLILSAVYLLAISAILRSNVLYWDDLARAYTGHAGWEPFSRYLSNFLSQYIHADRYLTDISPLPQILAVFVMALASIIAVYQITDKKEFSFWHLVSALPIGLSPYFLECLSYKYDSPYMALSVLFSVLPLLFARRNQIIYLLCTMCSMIAMCTTYQASAGIFPMLVIVTGICRWVRGEKTSQVMKFYAISAVGFIFGILFFWKFIMVEYIDYASTTVASFAELFATADFNYKRYIVYFINDFKPEWLVVSFSICVLFLWRAVTVSKQNKVATFVFVSLAMIAMFLLSFGVYPFLTSPLFLPRAMYGVGCFIGFLGIFASTEVPKGYAAKLACLVLGWYFFVFSFTYGNALNIQQEYTDFRITEAVADLAKCEELSEDEMVVLQVTGTIGYAPAVENMLEHFHLLEKIVPVSFRGDILWGDYKLRNYYGLPVMGVNYEPPVGDFTVVVDNYLHTIREREDYIWIELH